jgi:hypothetical protein
MADEKDASALLAHQLGTYHSLRVVLAVIGFALPIVVAAAGWWQCQVPPQLVDGSLSAYYHRVARFEFLTARDLFVGGLLAAAACLYAYKGFSTKENVALNLAAVFAIGVALLPTGHGAAAKDPDKATQACVVLMGADYQDARLRPLLHLASAVLFFFCLAYVSIWLGRDTLRTLNDQAKRDRYNRGYVAAGAVMAASPIIAMLVSTLATSPHPIFIFCVETFGVWAFSSYWLLKTREMQETRLDVKVAKEEVKRAQVDPQLPTTRLDKALRAIQVLRPGPVERVVPTSTPRAERVVQQALPSAPVSRPVAPPATP